MHSFCTEGCAASTFRSKALYGMLCGRQPALCGRLLNIGPKGLQYLRKGNNAMPFIPVAGVAQAEIRMTWDDQKVENTLYFDFGTTPTSGDLTTLGTDLLAWWTANIAPLTNQDVQLREIYLTDLTSATGAAVTVVPASPLFGEVNLDSLPNNVALCVSFRTAFRGRSFRGRNYVVGLSENQVSGSHVIETVSEQFVTAYEQLLSGGHAVSQTWVVVSRFTGNAPRTAGVATPIDTVLVVDSTVDSQRRRLPGRGQ
jgi:hypothetical protein